MIYNLTQHTPTQEQINAGVVNPDQSILAELRELITFNQLPSKEVVEHRVRSVVEIVTKNGYNAVMLGGAPFLMGRLETALKSEGVKVVYSFTERKSVESTDENGNVVKKSVFKHVGFVEA